MIVLDDMDFGKTAMQIVLIVLDDMDLDKTVMQTVQVG
jgi:hypothetical protein